MKLRTAVKRQARLALAGSRGMAVLILLLIGLVNLCVHLMDSSVFVLMGYHFERYGLSQFYNSGVFFSLGAMVYSVASLIIRMALVVPLLYGMVNWHLELTDRRRQSVFYIFWPYEGRAFWRCIGVTVSVFLRVLLVGAALFAIPVGLMVFARLQPNASMVTDMITNIGALLTLPAALAAWWFTRRYLLAPMLLGEKYGLTAHGAIKESLRLTRGHGWELVALDLSFLPWMLPIIGMSVAADTAYYGFSLYSLLPGFLELLQMTVAVLTVLWVVPYYTMTVVMYGRYLHEADAQNTAGQSGEGAIEDLDIQPDAEAVPDADIAADLESIPDELPKPTPPPERETVHWQDIL